MMFEKVQVKAAVAALWALMACAGGAQAQQALPGQRGAYASAEFGSGRIYGGNAGADRSMGGRALELRFGPELNPALVGAQRLFDPRATTRIDFVHYNEGHPENNHRDGFATQFVYTRQFGDSVTAEFGAGPYLSMNTTKINGVQIDDSNLGVLLSAAVRIPLERFGPDLHLRIGVNHVAMRDVHSSNALLVGIGRHFVDVPRFDTSELARSRLWLGGSVGNSITNQSGTDNAIGYLLEARRNSGKLALSGKLIFEGDDRSRVDRRGIAGQLWFVQPVTQRWSLGAGIGPYLAENERDHDHLRLHGLISMQAEHALSERTRVFVSFNRVKTFREKNDRDLFHLGVLRAFGG